MSTTAQTTDPSTQAVASSQHFLIDVEPLQEVLKMVGSIIEHSQVMQILSHVKLTLQGQQLIATASDSEIELVASTTLVEPVSEPFSIAISCRKMVEICKTLPSGSTISCTLSKGWLHIAAEQSKFTLATLSADSFPTMQLEDKQTHWAMDASILQKLMSSSAFAMAEQDVRFFLNGLHLRIQAQSLQMVATDGHRLAVAETNIDVPTTLNTQCIIPRKSALTLNRLLANLQDSITIQQTNQHICFKSSRFALTTNLLEGSNLECSQLIPNAEDGTAVQVDKLQLKQSLSRAAVLSHEKFRGAKLTIADSQIKILAHNTEQEKTEDAICIEHQGPAFEMAFNIHYLQDVLSVLASEDVTIHFMNNRGNAMIEESLDGLTKTYVVMSLNI